MDNKTKQELGAIGEKLAVDYLKKHGYRIVEQNYRTKLGEIDIIAQEGSYLCFVEVKTRKNASKGWPEEAIGREKIRKISQNALCYLKQKNISGDKMRFDVVAVVVSEVFIAARISLIKDAFELAVPYFT
ncbi:MAG: YraN family protein [Candidatus Omnitrophica bacterium]|nr:YraN family protein [Candidatus Omnitrophota bacterium]MBU4479603.1 YraN family protein [Candidatus Omnitrophota bacterium]MCG2703444.1 YraN family protein [Candidatus Omnitrophota bacterium]MCG2711405.1 YraN family protein [Candidatus Omnitrophota bacterium]